MQNSNKLSGKSREILSLIAEGHSYAQIVDGNQGFNYLDIFSAAEEAIRLNETESDYNTRIKEIKAKYPKAYELWSEEDDKKLRALFFQKTSIEQLAVFFQRQPSAIRSRIKKLDL